MRERQVIEHLRRRFPPAPAGEVWIGDDAAVVRPPPTPLVLASDAVVAGVHADLDVVGLDDVGWKAVAVNVSDLAAMGASASWALVSVVAPDGTDLEALFAGVAEAAAAYSCAVVGGDLAEGPALVVSVAVVGELGDGSPVLRSGAAAGDTLFVTGRLGASAAGLRLLLGGGDRNHPLAAAHRRPVARAAEGRAARAAGATAMIDLSDGVASDLRALADASGVGVAVDEVPVAPGATGAEALGGGEDYELLFTAPDAGVVADVFAAEGLRPPLVIGRCTPDPAERSLAGRPLPAGGWEHWGGG